LPADEKEVIRTYVLRRVTQRYSLSPDGTEFIFGMEGFVATLYNDQSGHCTIGYGHLVHRGACDGSESAEFRQGITKARARELAAGRVQAFENHLNQAVQVELTRSQVDALLSFIFNAGALHELQDPVNQGKFQEIPDLLLRTRTNNGKLLPRRRAEAALFARGDYNWRVTSKS
jgi:GH24 family phage-related lysozyme (muramidase)